MSQPEEKQNNSTQSERVLLVIQNETFKDKLEEAINRLTNKESRKAEFAGLKVEHHSKDSLSNELLEKTFLCFCDLDALETITTLFGKDKFQIPLYVLLPKFSTENIGKIYDFMYSFTRGFFHQDTEDPQTIGQIIGIVKNEFRRKNISEGTSRTKELGWLIKLSDNKDIYTSLFLDEAMRDFMQQLSFVIESIYHEKMPSAVSNLNNLFKEYFHPKVEKMKSSPPKKNTAAEKEKKEFGNKNNTPFKPQPILLEGETGAGKTLIAKRIHEQLKKLHGKEISYQHISTVNVGKNILEAELFGLVAGAWTGSVTRPGKLLMGRGGLIFLDEIGELPPEIQAKFLVYLDGCEFQPDGWGYDWKIWSPAYIVAATNKDLKQEVEKGNFRPDLYYRFKHKLRVPSLRERRNDIRPLIDIILQNKDLNKEDWVKEITLGAIMRLENYDFPGNFRELETILSRAVFRARQTGRHILREEDLEF